MWNDPRFQGGIQAFGGLIEAGIGAGMTLSTGGIAGPAGWAIMAHGLDHLITGMGSVIIGYPTESSTSQLFQSMGMSHNLAMLTDSGLSIAGSMYGLGAISASRAGSFPAFQLPESFIGEFSPTNQGLKTLGRNRLTPDPQTNSLHTVFRRDSLIGRVTHYETFRPQTNPYDPKLWESLKRFDNSGKLSQSHFNKVLKQEIFEPHVHDPYCPGGIRPAFIWEIPN